MITLPAAARPDRQAPRAPAVLRVGLDLDVPAEQLGVELARTGCVGGGEVDPYGLARDRGCGFCHVSPPWLWLRTPPQPSSEGAGVEDGARILALPEGGLG